MMIRVKKTMFHAASAFYKEIIDRISQEIILYNITNGGKQAFFNKIKQLVDENFNK
jgi:hypothetical protein